MERVKIWIKLVKITVQSFPLARTEGYFTPVEISLTFRKSSFIFKKNPPKVRKNPFLYLVCFFE